MYSFVELVRTIQYNTSILPNKTTDAVKTFPYQIIRYIPKCLPLSIAEANPRKPVV